MTGQHRAISAVLLATLMVLAGCTQTPASDSSTPVNTSSQEGTETTPNIKTSEPSETPTLETSTPEPEPRLNPWNQQNVSIAVNAPNVDNSTRHQILLQDSVNWINSQDIAAYPVNFTVVNSTNATVQIEASNSVSTCDVNGDGLSEYFCGPSYQTVDQDGNNSVIELPAQYDRESTLQIYRASLAYLVGSENPTDIEGADVPAYPPLRDPFPDNSPVPVQITGTENYTLAQQHLNQSIYYWTSGNGSEYRDYSVEFVIEPNNTDAPVTVRYVDSIRRCGTEPNTTNTAGCAPILDSTQSAEDAIIEISTEYAPESQQSVLTHEFGHLHGLEHGQGPTDVMAARSNLTEQAQPNVSEQVQPWESESVSVYINTDDLTQYETDQLTEETETALEYINSGADGSVPENMTFAIEEGSSEPSVDISIVDLESGAASLGYQYGFDPDDDGALESYTTLEMQIDDSVPENEYGYHIAYWIAVSFEQTELPDPLDGEDDDRSNWEN